MDNIKKNERLMEEGSFGELLIKMSLPAVVVILIMIIYNMADTYFIGQTGDPNKISGISICMPVFSVLSGVGTLFGIGGGTAISIALGEKNEDKIKHITALCSMGAMVVGVIFAAVVYALAMPLATLLGGDADTMSYAVAYLRVFAFACPFVLFSSAYGNILRSDGEAASAMIANISGTLFNIIGDAIFILVFHWDVFGAALATVLGNVLAVALIWVILIRKKRIFMPSLKNLTFRKEIVIPVLTLGLPMTFSTVLNSISSTIQNRLMISHGSICLAAQSVAGKMGMLITMLIIGINMGMQPVISYNFGSKNFKRMYQVVRQLAVFSVLVGFVLALIIYIFKDAAVAAFIDNEEVIAYGQVFVLASVCVGPIYGLYQVCQVFLQATGKAAYAIFVSLLDKGIVFIPVLFVLNKIYGAYGIAFSNAITMVASSVIAAVLVIIWARKMVSY